MELEKLPEHIAIIMDGNGRWAKLRNKPRTFGHIEGGKALKRIVRYCGKIGIKILSVFAFSTENWNRPSFEVETLMNLFIAYCKNEADTLEKNNVKLNFFGELDKLPSNVYSELIKIRQRLEKNTGLILNICINYSGKSDIKNAIKKILDNKISSIDVDENLISNYLMTKDIKDPDLLIRTSGEYRISNYFLWQLAYSELIFVDTLWPDFDEKELDNCILEYQKRDRRYGRIEE